MTNPCRLPLKPRALASALENLLGLKSLARIYDGSPPNLNPFEFLDYALNALGIDIAINEEALLDEIPKTGPVLVVANHPLGGLEGMAIAKVVGKYRPDLRVLTNEILRLIPELASIFIGVNVLSDNAKVGNVSGIRQVHKHLRRKGAILLFPAGMVSAYEFSHRRVQDRQWNRLAGQLLKKYDCTCTPVYVGGRNSNYFYGAGLVHPRLRTLLLPRQLANKQGFTLPLTIGHAIPSKELRLVQNPVAVTEYLRVATDALQRAKYRPVFPEANAISEVNYSQSSDELREAVTNMIDLRVVEHDDFEVYFAPYEQLGPVMEQIAIAREKSFRAVGEGTGLSKDSDKFDPLYRHLFLWDKSEGRIAGAYRVGLVDEIVAIHGVEGLYSRSLYKYDDAFIKQLGAAIEMGRSFIHPDYQRRSVSLNLLWRGIGQVLVKMPRYHTLFGSVSISREYSDLARSLIADTMLTNFGAKEFSQLVEPINPLKVMNRVWTGNILAELANVKTLSKLIGRCDPGKVLPVLLRHYLSLNGKLVCFNIHSSFNNSLEGLIIVDVRNIEHKTLSKFFGAEGLKNFLSFHEVKNTA